MSVVVRFGLKTIAMAALLVFASASHAAADVCLLTTAGSSCGPGQANPAFNAMGAIFQQIASQAVGNVFLSIKKNGTEKGYNTDGAFQSGFDMTDQSNATHSIKDADVPIVSITGTTYRQFFLDIQETPQTPSTLPNYLSLDKLKIFLGPTGSWNNYSNGMLNGISPIYDLDNGIDRWVKLDYSLNPTGMGDMVAYIPNSLFTSIGTNPYVYLYAQFGGQGGANSADGSFEEWWVNSPLAPVGPPGGPSNPEPAGIVLFGSGLVLAALRLRRKSPGDADKVPCAQTKVTADDDFPLQVL